MRANEGTAPWDERATRWDERAARRDERAARWGGRAARWDERAPRWSGFRVAAVVVGVLLAALFALASLAPLIDAGAALRGFSGGVAAALDATGAPVAVRAALAASLVAVLSFPLTAGAHLPGPRLLAAPIAVAAALVVVGALAFGVGAELVRQAALDPLAPAAAERSVFFRLGYAVGYLDLVDAVLGHLLAWIERMWPAFAALEAPLDDAVRAPVSALVYAGLVSFFALLPFWAGLALLWLLAARLFVDGGGSWRQGAMRLTTAALFAGAFLAVFFAVAIS